MVSYSCNQSRLYEDQLKALRSEGIPIILMSSRNLSDNEARHYAHYLRLPSGESIVEGIGTFFSQACIRYELSCLYATAFALSESKSAKHRNSVIRPDWA